MKLDRFTEKAQKALQEAAVDVTGNELSFSKAKVAVSAA